MIIILLIVVILWIGLDTKKEKAAKKLKKEERLQAKNNKSSGRKHSKNKANVGSSASKKSLRGKKQQPKKAVSKQQPDDKKTKVHFSRKQKEIKTKRGFDRSQGIYSQEQKDLICTSKRVDEKIDRIIERHEGKDKWMYDNHRETWQAQQEDLLMKEYHLMRAEWDDYLGYTEEKESVA